MSLKGYLAMLRDIFGSKNWEGRRDDIQQIEGNASPQYSRLPLRTKNYPASYVKMPGGCLSRALRWRNPEVGKREEKIGICLLD